jgi:hypothetical protein
MVNALQRRRGGDGLDEAKSRRAGTGESLRAAQLGLVSVADRDASKFYLQHPLSQMQ